MDKPGEVVRVSLEGYDVDGNRISDLVVNWYGFSNMEANVFQFAIMEQMVDLAKSFSDMKNAVVEVSEPVDQNPGRGILR
jgi:hypothetical protein